MKTRNSELLKDFTKFCKKNKELRFYQALVVWSGGNCLSLTDKDGVQYDTFYWEYNVLKENKKGSKGKKNKNII